MDFDQIIDLKARHASKWTTYEKDFGVKTENALPMWVADMDFVAPDFLTKCVRDIADGGFFGYFNRVPAYHEAVQWWMKTQHGWDVDTDWMTVTAGLGNGIATAILALSDPGDGVVIFTPVYLEFTYKIKKTGRRVVECQLALNDGRFQMDFDAYEKQMKGDEKIVLLCSPHNPGGRIWTVEEISELAAFCEKHNLILVADEIHADLVFPGETFVSTPVAIPDHADRLVVMTSASKTFNIAGTRTGCVTIQNSDLRGIFRTGLARTDLSPNLFGVALSQAAFSQEGVKWVEDVTGYLKDNTTLFHESVSKLPGVNVMPMQATYLSWVDFTDTGMSYQELWDRVTKVAGIVPSPGPEFGKGGEKGLRFNLGTPRSRVTEAIERMQNAFSDLQ